MEYMGREIGKINHEYVPEGLSNQYQRKVN
jgi:hypothetical protein